MTPEQLAADAAEAIQAGTSMVLVLPRPFKRPPKFPRGKLLCMEETSNVYSFDPLKILAWLAANNLATVVASVVPNAETRGGADNNRDAI